jgi:hypothetical protein
MSRLVRCLRPSENGARGGGLTSIKNPLYERTIHQESEGEEISKIQFS